jgi:AraC-like DNA-binding protein
VAKLSRAAFAERFQRLVGEPPLRYLRTWRLLNARRELAHGKASVRSVAEQAGYRTANGFSRAFRRFFSESPSAARRAS